MRGIGALPPALKGAAPHHVGGLKIAFWLCVASTAAQKAPEMGLFSVLSVDALRDACGDMPHKKRAF